MIGTDRENLTSLMGALGEAFSREQREGGRKAADALRDADVENYRTMPRQQDPSKVLATLQTLPDTLPLLDQVTCCQHLLSWTCWEGGGLATEVSNRLFTTELLGPDGHIYAEELRVGLLVSDAWTDYPVSSHSGEETYLVIAGIADWILGDSGYIKRKPGEFVHHPAWEPHGRKTTDQPFLGAWRWSGDIDLSTFSVA